MYVPRLFVLVSLILGFQSLLQAKTLSEWLDQARQNIVTEVLPNGLTVVCYSLPGTHKVQVGITYDVGGKNEQPQECGLAHMVEHMIFKGTQKMSETDLKAIADKYHIGPIGKGYNAATHPDRTRYYFNTDKNNWPVFLDILADCMFNVRFDENHFASEVKAVIEELNLRSTNLLAVVGDEYGSMMYPHSHPYHHPIGGYKEVLLKATSKDLQEFYRRNYGPSKALLTIVGDISTDEARMLARKAFSMTAPPLKSDVVCEPVGGDFMRKKTTLFKPIPRAQYAFLWKVPKDTLSRGYASCIAWILDGRLETILISEKDLVLSHGAVALHMQLGGICGFIFSLKDEVKRKEVTRLIHAELEKFIKDGPTQQEIERYKKKAEADFLKEFESCVTLGAALAVHYFPSRSLDEFFESIERYKHLTPEALKTFGQSYLRRAQKYTLNCLPVPENDKEQWAQMKKLEDAYEKEILKKKERKTSIEPARYVHELPQPLTSQYTAVKPDRVITLKNGLTVSIKKHEVSPFITSTLLFKDREYFEIREGSQKQSMVRIHAMKLLLEGTSKLTRDQIKEFFDLRGASVVTHSSGMSIMCLPEDFSEVVSRSLVVLKDPQYDAKVLSREVHTLLAHYTQARMNPGYMARRLLQLELLQDYPWTYTDEELCKQLQTITHNDVRAFNKRYINPRNMFLVVVGNIDLMTIGDELERTFGSWKEDKEYRPLFEKAPFVPEIIPQKGTVHVHPISVDQMYLAFGRVTNYQGTKDALVLKLIEPYVNLKVFEIREQTGLFYASDVSLARTSLHQKGYAELLFPVSVGNSDAVESAVKELFKAIAQNGIPQEVLERAKDYYHMTLVKSCSTPADFSTSLQKLIENNLPLDFHEKTLEQVQALTKKEVDEIVRKYFEPSGWTLYKVGRVETPNGDVRQSS